MEERPWPEVAVKILAEVNCLKQAEARHYAALNKRIDDLCSDLRVHKVKTGFVASIAAAATILAAWALSLLRGGS